MESFENTVIELTGNKWVGIAITACVFIIITAAISHLVTRFLRKVLNRSKDLPSSSIFINIARIIVWSMGLSAMLSTCFKIDITAALTALGIGGIAVSLGFQDTISNLIGGLQVSVLKVIQPGDNISVGSSNGIVTDITWRHTKIKSAKGEVTIIPNSAINKNSLTILPPANKVSLPICVQCTAENLDDIAAKIEATALESLKKIGKVEAEPKLNFSEITEGGFLATLTFTLGDAKLATHAKDAVLRAAAPYTLAQTKGQ